MKMNNIQLSLLNRKSLLLIIGALLIFMSHLTYGVDVIAWISMVPFLIYLAKTEGWRSRLIFSLVLILSWSVTMLKIVSDPIPPVFIFMYAIPIGLIHLPGYLLWAKYRHRRYGVFVFPAVMIVMEWLQYTFTPLASWGVAAYTQSNSHFIMQVVSIFGMAGLGFLIYWVNTAVAEYILNRKASYKWLIVSVSCVIIIISWGAIRAALGHSQVVETTTVAAVGTDSEIGGLPLPTDNKNENDIKAILSRSKTAARAGAKIVVWNEGAFLLYPDNESFWIERFQQFAQDNQVSLVASYILLTSESPLRYDNKYILIDTLGDTLQTYLKHEPVPGEPARKGLRPQQTTHIDNTNLGGAICYDYDFPYLAKTHGKLKADIVAVPSSDWKGIDPLHTKMAAFRAVEQGHSIIRSTRFGLSAAISPYGDMVSKQSSFDNHNKIMLSELPRQGVTTIYSVIGDLFVYLCVLFILIFTLIRKP
jgi:apolipoprotein N-acyltransferase